MESLSLDNRTTAVYTGGISDETLPVHPLESVASSEANDIITDLPSTSALTSPLKAPAAPVDTRGTLSNYRPSDYVGKTEGRDSLMPGGGHMKDMGELLCDMDDSYRLTAGTQRRLEEEGLPLLLQLAKDGKVEELKSLIKAPSNDLLCRDLAHGQTALHFAVRSGQLNVVHELCAPEIVKSIIDVPDNRKNSALHLAAVKSRRIVKFLLEAGAKVDTFNMRNQTALGVHIMTAKKDETIMAEILLVHKANPNASIENSTLIHVALDRGLIDIACRLVRHGARLDMKDENGKMVFDKVNRTVLRKLISKISFPPVWVPNEERPSCMLCSKKFSKISVGVVRRHHCRHCGRVLCGDCSHLSVESFRFPPGFTDRLKPGAKADSTQKRVCKTCYGVFKERQAATEKSSGKESGGNFYDRVVNIKWDEVAGQANAPGSTI